MHTGRFRTVLELGCPALLHGCMQLAAISLALLTMLAPVHGWLAPALGPQAWLACQARRRAAKFETLSSCHLEPRDHSSLN